MSTARRRAAALALAAVLVAAVPRAGSTQEAAPTGRVSLASQTTFVTDGGAFNLRLDVERVRRPAEVELAVTVHRAVTSRSQFQRTLDGELLGRRLRPPAVARLADLQFDAAGAVRVALPLAELGIRAEGVHPVSVQLRGAGSGQVLDGFVTYLVYTRADPDRQPLSVAWIQPVGARPALTPDGDVASGAALQRVAGLATALAGEPAPLTLQPVPETLEALQASGHDDAVADLRRAAADRQVLLESYVHVDAAALVGAGLVSELIEQRSQGSDTIEAVLGVRPDPRTWSSDERLDAATLARLRDLGVDRVVVPEDSLVPLDLRLTLARPFRLEDAGGRSLDGAAADPGLADHFERGDDEVLAAHQLLADLAVLFFDQPGRERGVVVRPPRRWQPSADFLSTALGGLRAAAVLRPVTVDELFDAVPDQEDGRGAGLVRRPEPGGPPRLGVPAGRFERLRRSLGGLGSMVGAANADLGLLQRLLLVAGAAGLEPADRQAYLSGVDRGLRQQLDTIRVAEQGSFRLTAREGTIPLTLLKQVPYDVRISVVLESDKLEFLDSTDRSSRQTVDLVLDKQANRLAVPVRARTSGAFTIRVRLVSPDGRLEVSRSRYTVRSTVVSGVGIVLSVGAGAFLLVWWAGHWRTVRRDRRLVEAA